MKFIKNKTLKKAVLPLLVGFSLLAGATSTIAWFHNGVNISFNGGDADFNINAGAEAAYYGGGTGTSTDPYIISNKLHLYNLAWLQYMGTYNKTNIRQLYFKVTENIDMDGITLPPIGTDQYPFLGHFDGNNKTISNLTISNDDPLQANSAFGMMKPAVINLTGTTPPEIVGFFGAVGKLPTQDFTYDSSIVSMTNLTISNINVVSESNKTLIGLAAGYVDGEMKGIKIGGESSLTVAGQTAVSNAITSKLSDYGLVGYAANKGASGEYKQTLSKYYDSDNDTQGGGENWGGSIDMSALYTRLTTVEDSVSNYTPTYVYTESYLDGVYENRVSKSNMTRTRRWHQNTGTNYAGNYVLTQAQTNKVYLVGGHYVDQLYYRSVAEQGYYITDGNGHYLSYNGNALVNTGAEGATVWLFENTSGTSRIYTTYFDETNLGISTVYLRSNNNALNAYNGNQTGTTYRTPWTLTKNGDELSIIYNNYHLLYYNNNWTLRQNGYGDDYVETTNNPSFYVIGNTNQSYYIASSNNIGNGTAVGTTNNLNNAAHFTLNNSNQAYVTSGNYNYYPTLVRSGRNNNYTYSLTWRRSTGNNYAYFVYNSAGNYFSATIGNATRYLSCSNNGTWGLSETAYTVSMVGYSYEVLKLYNTLDQTAIQKTGRQLVDNNSHGHMEFDNEDTTYFPINVFNSEQRDELNNVTAKKYEPTPTNTGYIVAGTTQNEYAADNRSIVVSNYPRNWTLYNSLDNSGNIEHVKTINENGIEDLNETGLKKYNDYVDEHGDTISGSKTKFQNVIKGSSSVGGLHFVNKNTAPTFSIGKDNLVDATNIKVNGATYTGDNEKYQLPVYSIDFNLKKQGYINFFAGTYNGGYSENDNSKRAGTVDDDHINAFFSLHHIIRDPNDKKLIDDIKEIKGIYSAPNSAEYTYSYKKYTTGNNFTVVDSNGNAFNDSGLTLLFDTDWIGYHPGRILQENSGYDANDPTKGTLGAIFYFEIPVDSGEYCLGNVRNSVDNHDPEGAYLMYLDIGANGTEGTDHYSGYNITTYVNPISFPTGVDFAIDGLTNAGLGGETLCVFIDTNGSGTIYFSVNEDQPANDTIKINDASQISQYSYLSASADAETGFDIVGTNLPAEFEDPPDSNFIVSRVSYLSLMKVTGEKYLVTVTDELDEDGEVVSTVYHLSYTDENDELVSRDCTLAELQQIIPSAEDYYINSIRDMIVVVTIERLSATSVSFNAQLPELPWTTESNMYLVTLNIPSGYSVKVSVINSTNYSVCINSETPLVFTNNTATYTQP